MDMYYVMVHMDYFYLCIVTTTFAKESCRAITTTALTPIVATLVYAQRPLCTLVYMS